MASQQIDSTHSGLGVQRAQSLQTGLALAFGLLVLFAVGFMPTDAVHNAAHDARHALAFPCH